MEKYFTIRNGRANLASTKNFSTLHIGCITPYLGTKDNVPRGYLLADGASYKTTDYPELFDIIGYTYGGSDGTFNVPNLCDGRFLEGSDTSGEYVEAGLPNITGKLVSLNAGTSNFKSTEFVNGAFSAQTKWNALNGEGNMDSYGEVSFDASKSNAIYSDDVDTVQPKSLRVLYIIKAFHTNEGTDSNEVTDQIIEYVEGEIDALISDTTTSETSTWSSSKIASEINPTIDISKVFSNGALNIATLCSTYGNGRYVIVGQGTAGNGSATIDIWTLASHAISYIVNVTYSNKTSNTFIGLTYENPTINFETSYLSACNHIAKVCTLA